MTPTRLTRLVLVLVLVVVAVGGCGGGGDDDGSADPGADGLELAERVLAEGELAGFSPGDTGEWHEAEDFAENFRLVDPSQLARRLASAGFVVGAGNSLVAEGGSDSRHAVSFAVQLESATAAAQELDWIFGNAAAPCPPGCGVRARPLEVVGIPGARGVQLLARRRTQFGPPFESYRLLFGDGPFLYTIVANGRPGTVPRNDVLSAAEAMYDRVKGRPAPS